MQENSPESRLVACRIFTTRPSGSRRGDRGPQPDHRWTLRNTYLHVTGLGETSTQESRDTIKSYEQLDALLKINDDDAEALLSCSRSKMQENKPEEAVPDLEDILKKVAEPPRGHFISSHRRGFQLGSDRLANAFISDLERFHPTYLKAGLLKNTGRVHRPATPTGDQTFERAYRERRQALPTPNPRTSEDIRDLRMKAIILTRPR